MRGAFLALLGCLGCDQVLGLDDREPPPLSVPNAPPCLGPGEKIVLPLVADTYLEAGDETPRGDSSVVQVGGGRVALLRFAAGANALQELSVTLSHADTAVACGSGDTCASCAAGAVGELVIHLMRPDWDEATATHVQRTQTESWTMPGAAGADRSAALCTTAGFDGFDAACKFTFAPTDLGWQGDISVQIRAQAAATGVFGSREGVDQCAGRTPTARAIATCRRVATCGNRVVDAGEGCDDGNSINEDGCSDVCTIETSTPVCGNGSLETDEQCDDSNTNPGDGCDASCMIEAFCGNGRIDDGEQCDDANDVNGDDCTNLCWCTQLQCAIF